MKDTDYLALELDKAYWRLARSKQYAKGARTSEEREDWNVQVVDWMARVARLEQALETARNIQEGN